MSALTFDTLKVTRNLISAGLPEPHAEAVTSAIKEAQDSHVEQLATKSDIERLETKIDGELKLIKWMLALIILVTVLPILKSLFPIL